MSSENMRRDQAQGCVIDPEAKTDSNDELTREAEEEEERGNLDLDVSDWVNKSFRYCL